MSGSIDIILIVSIICLTVLFVIGGLVYYITTILKQEAFKVGSIINDKIGLLLEQNNELSKTVKNELNEFRTTSSVLLQTNQESNSIVIRELEVLTAISTDGIKMKQDIIKQMECNNELFIKHIQILNEELKDYRACVETSLQKINCSLNEPFE